MIPKRNEVDAIEHLLTVATMIVVAYHALETLFTTDSDVTRWTLGVAMAYMMSGILVFLYKYIVKPIAGAIVEDDPHKINVRRVKAS